MFVTRAAFEAVKEALAVERQRYDDLLTHYHALRQANYAPRLPDERAVVPPVPEPEEQMVNAQRRMAIDAAMADLKAQGIPEGKAREEAERMIGSIFAPITADDLLSEGAY